MRKNRRIQPRSGGTFPRLTLEPLEDRRLLTITVDTLVDELDFSIVDGDISLRDAMRAAAPGRANRLRRRRHDPAQSELGQPDCDQGPHD